MELRDKEATKRNWAFMTTVHPIDLMEVYAMVSYGIITHLLLHIFYLSSQKGTTDLFWSRGRSFILN